MPTTPLPDTCPRTDAPPHLTSHCHHWHDVWLGHRDLCPIQWGEACDCEDTPPPTTTPPTDPAQVRIEETRG